MTKKELKKRLRKAEQANNFLQEGLRAMKSARPGRDVQIHGFDRVYHLQPTDTFHYGKDEFSLMTVEYVLNGPIKVTVTPAFVLFVSHFLLNKPLPEVQHPERNCTFQANTKCNCKPGQCLNPGR